MFSGFVYIYALLPVLLGLFKFSIGFIWDSLGRTIYIELNLSDSDSDSDFAIVFVF